MFGLNIVKGLGVTLKHFIETYIDDLKYFPKSMVNEEAFAHRQGPDGGRGLFTVEYPEMKLKTPENFRFIPFLVTDYEVPKDSPDFDREEWLKQDRCTSCGICAKVCPPQCIWIVRTNDPETGKPIPQPAEFYIDTDICMNCGYCAEFCPFDAIKMDHDYELADFEREVGHIHDLERLLKPASYYASIRPTWFTKEEEAKRAAEEEKRRKAEEKKRKQAEKAAAKKAKEEAVAKAGDGDKPKGKRSPEEVKAQREAMLAKKKAREAGDEAAPAKQKRSPEEIKAQREAMLAKKKAREAGGEVKAEETGKAEETEKAEAAPAKPKRSPEEIKAQREAMMAKRRAREAGGEVEAKPVQEAPKAEPSDGDGQSAAAKEAKAETPPAKPDDLTKIEGIGPKIAELLQAAGINTFVDLAAAEVDRIQQILADAGARYKLADPTSWPEQAKLAAEGKWDELEKLQDQLEGGRHK
jgi:NADH-quinone oxidoreductase subunit I